jgi:hypothetical protein
MLAIAGTTAIGYSTTNARTSYRSSADQKAYALAEAGVNNAMAVLSLPENNALDPYLLPTRTMTAEGGTVTYSGVLDQSTATWRIISTALTRNPTGPSASPVRRVLTVDVPVDASFSQPLNNMAWNYIWAKATGSTCDMTIGQSVNVATPLFVEGNLCLQNTATISGGPLVVKGSLTMSQKANGVGQPGNKVNEAHIGGACQYWNKAADYPCQGASDNVYAKVLDSSVPALTPPTADWSEWYLNASPGPYYPCYQQSGTVPVFDADQGSPTSPDASKRSGSVLTVANLTPGASYSCKTAGGELRWNVATKVLTVKGTVYIDGSAVIDNGGTDTYDGQGSLYLTGTLLIKKRSSARSPTPTATATRPIGTRTRGCWSSRPMGTVASPPRRLDPARQRGTPRGALRDLCDRQRHDVERDRPDDRKHRCARPVRDDVVPGDSHRADGHAVVAEHDLRAAAGGDGLHRLSPQPEPPARR